MISMIVPSLGVPSDFSRFNLMSKVDVIMTSEGRFGIRVAGSEINHLDYNRFSLFQSRSSAFSNFTACGFHAL